MKQILGHFSILKLSGILRPFFVILQSVINPLNKIFMLFVHIVIVNEKVCCLRLIYRIIFQIIQIAQYIFFRNNRVLKVKVGQKLRLHSIVILQLYQFLNIGYYTILNIICFRLILHYPRPFGLNKHM